MSVQPSEAVPGPTGDRSRQDRPADRRRRPRCDENTNSSPPISLLLREHGFLGARRPGRAGRRRPVAHRDSPQCCASWRIIAPPPRSCWPCTPTSWPPRRGAGAPEGADRRPAEARRGRAPPAPDLGRLRLAAGLRHGREGRGRLQGQRPEGLRQRRAVGQLFMTGAVERRPKEGPTVLQFGVPMNARRVDRRDLGHARHARHRLAQRQARERVRGRRRDRRAPPARRLASARSI